MENVRGADHFASQRFDVELRHEQLVYRDYLDGYVE